MRLPQPIIVIDLFPEVLDQLLALLASLSAAEWDKPSACPGWSVKDVALHLLGDEVGKLSRGRDGFSSSANIKGWQDLVTFINAHNALWVEATRRVSPQLLIDLLRLTGSQVCAYFSSLDPHALGDPVSWAGAEPVPVWLDLAREYTERWLHQQHIREAVGRPGLKQSRYLAPVLDTFVRALPHTFRDVSATDGTLVALTVSGASGGRWFLLRERGDWKLYLGVSGQPDAEVVVEAEVAWRVFTKGVSRDEARAKVTLLGDRTMGMQVLDMVSIIA